MEFRIASQLELEITIPQALLLVLLLVISRCMKEKQHLLLCLEYGLILKLDFHPDTSIPHCSLYLSNHLSFEPLLSQFVLKGLLF